MQFLKMRSEFFFLGVVGGGGGGSVHLIYIVGILPNHLSFWD